jgi:flagellar protein FlgJ
MTQIAPASAAPTGATGAAASPKASGVVKKMEGILWYNMLSEMNQNGLDTSALGAGGGAYQSLFLWDIAQNDFDKYDTGLLSATLHQIGGRAALAPPPVSDELSPLATDPTAEASFAPAGGTVTDAVVLAHAANLTRSIWPAVQMAASVLGVPPVAVLAQAALETGWGNSMPGNNVFGIKASGDEPSSTEATHEMVDGAMVSETANFRDYPTPLDCVSDYIRLIQSNFQTVIGQGTVAGFAQALQSGGYATDSGYASKIITIAQSPMMAQMLQSVGTGAGTGTGTAAGVGATPSD